ncbi:MAG: dienelactone hydrolase family protein [Candidatus Brocadia sp.]
MTYNEDLQSSPAILLCAPHPNLGGDMDNNIITSIARVSADMGFASLRFNYRGVGNSECHVKDIAQRFQYWDISLNGGDYTDAVADTHAAINYLVSQIGVTQGIFIAGYSFGAITGMSVGVESKNVKAFASISTPFGQYPLDFLQECKKGKLFIYSRNDFAATVEDTIRGFKGLPPPKVLELIEDSDHFYRGQEDRVSQKVCVFFQISN